MDGPLRQYDRVEEIELDLRTLLLPEFVECRS